MRFIVYERHGARFRSGPHAPEHFEIWLRYHRTNKSTVLYAVRVIWKEQS
jgi:hypothetical protein